LATPDRKDKEKVLRAYGLDRMYMPASTDKKSTNKAFTITEIKEMYRDCFAMFNANNEAEEVVLSFDRHDGQYVETFKIHHSQTSVHQGERIIVTLKIKITNDFIMELMSRAWSVEVLQPLSLRQKLHDFFKEAAERNGGI